MPSRGTQPVADVVALQQDQPAEAGLSNDLELSESLKMFFGMPATNVVLLVSVLIMQYAKVLTCIVALMSLALSSILQIVGMSTMGRISGQDVEWPCQIVYFSTVLRMVAAASLLVFFGDVHAVVVLPLSLLVLAIVAFFFRKMFYRNNKDIPGCNWAEYKAELKIHLDLSSKVVSMAFAGLIGTVIGYAKDHLNLTNGYMTPQCFLFYSVILGLLVVLLCTVPPHIPLRETKPRVARVYIPILSYVALLFLVLAGVMAAEEILREYVFLACFVIVAIAVRCFFYDNDNGATSANGLDEQDANMIQHFLVVCFVPLFGILMLAHLKYGNETGSTVSSSWLLKAFVLSVVCGILNYAARMVVFAELQGPKHPFPKMVWTKAIQYSMASSLICALILGFGHQDEIKNIF